MDIPDLRELIERAKKKAEAALNPKTLSKYPKERRVVQVVLCSECGKGGGTLLSVGDGYRHASCQRAELMQGISRVSRRSSTKQVVRNQREAYQELRRRAKRGGKTWKPNRTVS